MGKNLCVFISIPLPDPRAAISLATMRFTGTAPRPNGKRSSDRSRTYPSRLCGHALDHAGQDWSEVTCCPTPEELFDKLLDASHWLPGVSEAKGGAEMRLLWKVVGSTSCAVVDGVRMALHGGSVSVQFCAGAHQHHCGIAGAGSPGYIFRSKWYHSTCNCLPGQPGRLTHRSGLAGG